MASLLHMKLEKLLLVFTCTVVLTSSVMCEESSKSKLLLVIVDGFSNDYLVNSSLAGFESFLVNGSKAEYLTPVYPTTTFPNVFSMLTGVYPENHGFVADVVYDPVHGTNFTGDETNFEGQPYWWNTSDPVWASAKDQGIRTGIYSMFGCQVPVRGLLPYICQHYSKLFHQDTISFDASLEQAVKTLANGNIDFAIVYTEYLDIYGHIYGPSDPQMTKATKLIDHSIGRLMNLTGEYRQLADNLNIIIASDHGMADTTERDKRISLEHIIKEEDIEFITGSGAFAGIYPKADKLMKVYDDLKKTSWFTTWKRNDIPEYYHIKKSDRTAPIVIAAKPGYRIVPVFSDIQIPKPQFDTPITQLGEHGYDPDVVKEMNGIFLARGPGIKKNVTTGQMKVVDVYNVMNCLLNITGHANNGTWSNVCGLLTSNCNKSCDPIRSSAFSIRPIGYFILCLSFIVFAINR